MDHNVNGALVLFVADTGNHQSRKVTLVVRDDNITLGRNITSFKIECFSGRCHTDMSQEKERYEPRKETKTWYSDRSREESRLDYCHTGDVYVADTNNHLIRKIDRFGKSLTIAGSTKIAEQVSFGKELEGCPSPCLAGTQGQKDGFALDAKFSFLNDLVISVNQSALFVTDRHQIRGVDLRTQTVATLTGFDHESDRDGFGPETSFNQPKGVVETADGSIFVSDSASCHTQLATFRNEYTKCQMLVG
jgi:hypothetical protein